MELTQETKRDFVTFAKRKSDLNTDEIINQFVASNCKELLTDSQGFFDHLIDYYEDDVLEEIDAYNMSEFETYMSDHCDDWSDCFRYGANSNFDFSDSYFKPTGWNDSLESFDDLEDYKDEVLEEMLFKIDIENDQYEISEYLDTETIEYLRALLEAFRGDALRLGITLETLLTGFDFVCCDLESDTTELKEYAIQGGDDDVR